MNIRNRLDKLEEKLEPAQRIIVLSAPERDETEAVLAAHGVEMARVDLVVRITRMFDDDIYGAPFVMVNGVRQMPKQQPVHSAYH